MPANRDVTSVETYSGQYVDLIDPDPKTIRLEDIAVGLANTARFAGQTTRFYSVAEHAVRVSYIVTEQAPPGWRDKGLWPGLALMALHHDSHEAYIGDIIAPLKKVLRDRAPSVLADLANVLDGAIMQALKIPYQPRASLHRLKDADDEAMYREASALKWSHGVGPHWLNDEAYEPWADIGWSPDRAVRKFLQRHEELRAAADDARRDVYDEFWKSEVPRQMGAPKPRRPAAELEQLVADLRADQSRFTHLEIITTPTIKARYAATLERLARERNEAAYEWNSLRWWQWRKRKRLWRKLYGIGGWRVVGVTGVPERVARCGRFIKHYQEGGC